VCVYRMSGTNQINPCICRWAGRICLFSAIFKN